jgi:hypothetical protein
MKQIILVFILMTNFIVVTNALTGKVQLNKRNQSEAYEITPTIEERLQLCYIKNPILLNLLIITDEEFNSTEKRNGRVKEINGLYLSQKDTLNEKKAANLKNCYKDLINAPDNIKDKESLAYTILRLQEVKSVFHKVE